MILLGPEKEQPPSLLVAEWQHLTISIICTQVHQNLRRTEGSIPARGIDGGKACCPCMLAVKQDMFHKTLFNVY